MSSVVEMDPMLDQYYEAGAGISNRHAFRDIGTPGLLDDHHHLTRG